MHRLNELAARLTPDQLKEVEDFAEFLAARTGPSSPTPAPLPRGANAIRLDALQGMCRGIGGDKSTVELVRETLDSVAEKYSK